MRKIKFIFIIAFLIIFFISCTNKSDEYTDPRGTDYAGTESCIQCHKTQYELVSHSSHFKSTSPATKENILGDFTKPHNTFFFDKNTKILMEMRNDSLYQVLYKNGKQVEIYSFGIIFGIKHAQTSGYWKNNYAYELPISYYKSINNWATSPGFSATTTNFERKIEKECFGCHSSNASSRYLTTSSDSVNFMTMDTEDFISKKALIYGIDCERCHGPAKEHVQTHLKFPDLKKAQNIVVFKDLNRQQKLDACALCHAGNDKMKLKSRFNYKPGENLSNYFRENPGIKDSLNYDVHGNQYGLLSQSKCFKKTETMDCITCHNPHQNASQNLASYSKICMSCHQESKHSDVTLKTISKSMLANNCVECHMPKQDSKAIRFQQSYNSSFNSYSLRTHKIAIYPTPKK